MATAKPVPRIKPGYADRTTKKSRGETIAPGKADQREADAQALQDANDKRTPEQQAMEHRYAVITATIDNYIREAITARETSGIEEIWAEDDDQYNGIDGRSIVNANVKTRGQVPRSDKQASVFVPITKPKTDTAVARVTEMLLPNDNSPPFEIKPTPIPELEDMAENGDPDATVTLGDGTIAPAQLVAAMHMDKCREFAEAESLWVQDKFTEGDVYGHMRQVLRDSARIGTGVIRGPIPVSRLKQRWHRGPAAAGMPSNVVPLFGSTARPAGEAPTPGVVKFTTPFQSGEQSGGQPGAIQPTPVARAAAQVVRLVRIEEIMPTSVCVRAQDCYPDPACGDSIHDGAYFVFRDYLTGKALKGLARLPGYDPKCIVDCLKEGPMPYTKRRMSTERVKIGDTTYDSKLFEVFYVYAEMTPEDLRALKIGENPYPKEEGTDDENAEAAAADTPATGEDGGYAETMDIDDDPLKGVLSDEDLLYLQSVPVIVTMIHGRPVRCEVNPLATGKFPFDFFPWEPVKGQPWGRGIPRQMGVAQRMLNAATRRLLQNAGLAAGVQIVITKGAVTPWDGKYEVTSPKGWDFNPEETGIDDVRKAFNVFEIPSVQADLSAIIQYALDLSDRLTNMPMLMQGDQQPGDAPETLGGRKLFFDNAMSPLRVIAKGWDDKLMVPHIKRWHDYGQEHGPESIKGGDMDVVGLGSTAMLQREEGRIFLMQLYPQADDPALRINKSKLVEEMARSNGFDLTRIQRTKDEQAQWEQEQAQKGQPEAPQVAAARIRKETVGMQLQAQQAEGQQERQFQEQQDERQQMHERALKQIDKLIADDRLQGEDRKAMVALKVKLATDAMGNRMKSDEMNLKLDPANQSHLGI